jgi:predicted dehydrogenase
MDRRKFLKSSAVLGSSIVLPFSFPEAAIKIKIAILGTGWWGTDILLPNMIATGYYEIVALCDIHSGSLKNASDIVVNGGGKQPKLFSNYREMFKLPGLQAVVIATPTHWHALQFIDACNAGLDVFLEKPISYDIREGQAMVDAWRKAKNVVQVDFPRVTLDSNAQIKTFIDSGEAGKILQVQVNIHNTDGFLVEKPIPETIDFEKFCGPAPATRYLCSENGDKPNWRGQHVFSRGVLADWGIHYIHNVRKILNLDLPDSVAASGGITKNFTQDNPDFLDVHFNFDGLPVNWSHKSYGYTAPNPDHRIGAFFFGEKGTIFQGDLSWEFYPAGNNEKISFGDVGFHPGNPEFVQVYHNMIIHLFDELAVGIRNKNEKGITNTLADAFKSTSTVIYGDMAYRVKAEIAVDKLTMNIRNNPDAQNMLKRDYRAPYFHPYVT